MLLLVMKGTSPLSRLRIAVTLFSSAVKIVLSRNVTALIDVSSECERSDLADISKVITSSSLSK
ncbi:hypothetical protein AB6G22_07740 [Providencia hangzhouensis]|uniref:hypothetical protein n=1 Tax=Providencia hangzhouensis TaxID=3031799 RepID=UPI0034DCD7FA